MTIDPIVSPGTDRQSARVWRASWDCLSMAAGRINGTIRQAPVAALCGRIQPSGIGSRPMALPGQAAWVDSRQSPGATTSYVSLACPWAHRTLIFRKLKGLADMIDFSVVHWLML